MGKYLFYQKDGLLSSRILHLLEVKPVATVLV